MIKTFDIQLREAIRKYGDNHIDIAVEEENVYAFYHSRHNSFNVTDKFSLKDLGGMSELKKYEIEFEELCICED